VRCWGEMQVYLSGKLAFSYICPLEDLGLPLGYKSTKAGKNAAVQGYKDLLSFKNQRRKKQIKDNSYNF